MKTKLVTVFLLIIVVVAIFTGIRQRYKKNSDRAVSAAVPVLIEKEKELQFLRKKLDELSVQTDTLEHIFNFHGQPNIASNHSKPTNNVNSSFHDGGYEDSWIKDVDPKKRLVLITTLDSKISIIFKPASENISNFHVGWLAPVTFKCSKIRKGKCDLQAPYKLFVSNGLVEVKQLKFPKK